MGRKIRRRQWLPFGVYVVSDRRDDGKWYQRVSAYHCFLSTTTLQESSRPGRFVLLESSWLSLTLVLIPLPVSTQFENTINKTIFVNVSCSTTHKCTYCYKLYMVLLKNHTKCFRNAGTIFFGSRAGRYRLLLYGLIRIKKLGKT